MRRSISRWRIRRGKREKSSARSPVRRGLSSCASPKQRSTPMSLISSMAGEESKCPGEERMLMPSPKDVATYDLKPEMSARPVTEALVEYLREHDVGMVIANYANADMVGHTGNFEAAVRACEVIDECLGKLVDAALTKKGTLIIN